MTQILSLLPNSITYGSDTSDRTVGKGEGGQYLERGELTLAPGLGRNHTSRKDQKESSGGSAQVLHLIARWISLLELQVSSTCCKRNKCRMKLTSVDKDSTSKLLRHSSWHDTSYGVRLYPIHDRNQNHLYWMQRREGCLKATSTHQAAQVFQIVCKFPRFDQEFKVSITDILTFTEID